MGVPVGDEVAVGEGSPQSFVTPARRARVVDQPDTELVRIDDTAPWKSCLERRLVHVPVHGRHRSDLLELVEERRGGHVPNVQDELRALEEPQTALRKPASAAREVRVSDERDQRNSGRNAPSR